MSSDRPVPGEPEGSPWEKLLRSVLGDGAEDALRELRERGMDLDGMADAAGLTNDPRMLDQLLAQVRAVLSSSGRSPVNTDVARDIARQTAAQGDPSLSAGETRTAVEALSVADLWLDSASDVPPRGARREAWSRSEWVEHTLPAWNALVEPVASSVADALAGVLPTTFPEDMDGAVPEQLAGMLGGDSFDPTAMIRRLGSAVYGMQLGQAAGTLSREVFGATDIGVPLLAENMTVLVPTNIAAFAEGLDAPLEEVRLFLALREAAHARLFTHVTWLRGHLLGLVDAYARGITIDTEALEEAVSGIDPSDPAALQSALSGGVFGIGSTPEQRATLERLETSLALVEGWVDEVTTAAAIAHLPHTMALREMIRRRRAAGGPAEQIFASLVGLELRPRRSREAATLWARIATDSGPSARDAVWDHPDLMPGAVDLDDPAGYAARRAEEKAEQSDVDRAIEALLAGDDPTGDDPAGGDPAGGDQSGTEEPDTQA
ncbi:MAG: zinc-dependent metalloprotease [Cellulomonadaceae bacterium]